MKGAPERRRFRARVASLSGPIATFARGGERLQKGGNHEERDFLRVRAACRARVRDNGFERGSRALRFARSLHGRRQLGATRAARSARLRGRRGEPGGRRCAGRPRADEGRGGEARGARRRRQAKARQARPDPGAACGGPGREIIALKVTKDAKTVADGARPDVLYMSTIHAREWIANEVNRRLLHHFVDNYGTNAEVTNLVNTRELWFMVIANPDGYQYTFDHERLWRKNLRDNDGDGQITNADGVDLNRNYDVQWGSDAGAVPEVKAHQALIDRLKFKFLVTYHS